MSRGTRRERLMVIAAPVVAFMAPVVECLGTLGIPVHASPALWLLGGVGGLGLLCGVVGAGLSPAEGASVWRRLALVGVLTGAVLLAVDLGAGGNWILSVLLPATEHLGGPWTRRAVRLVLLAIPSALIFLALWKLGRHRVPLLFVMALAWFASSTAINLRIFLPAETVGAPEVSPAETDRPPFVYLLLDEAMGVEGVSMAPGGASLARDLRAFADQHGFRLHGGAFSRHFTSGRSIPAALSFDFSDDQFGTHLSHSENGTVRSVLFDELARDGYEVVVYGTPHVNFCFASAGRCEVLDSFNPYNRYLEREGAAPRTMAGSAAMRAQAAFFFTRPTLNYSILLYHYLNVLTARPEEPLPDRFYTLDPYMMPGWFERFAADVRTSPRGRAYFAHFLLPHAPYVFDSQCAETGQASVGYFLTEEHQLTGEAFERERAAIYEQYHQQYRCVLKLLDGFLGTLSTIPEFDDATIVLQGDHGARISAGRFAETLNERDLVDNHSALFAIRSPAIEPGYDTRKTSIQRLNAEYFGPDPDRLPPDNGTVVNDSRSPGRVEVRQMPDFADAR